MFIHKDAKFHSLNLILLGDTCSQRIILKQSNYDKIKDLSKIIITHMSFNWAREKSFKSIGYFNAEIGIDDSKFETYIFVRSDSSINFDLIISTDIIHQGTLTVSGNDVKYINMKTTLTILCLK